ncbi:DMT family transporter [Diaphorobacter sp. HDW4A]|uniref:DMT family transporter n=1 Tax=Diaphorobacter sp. HDW4A TaxID=2714924 RepID=UPI00197CBB4D|nr:DMT family transporter [Diaphorobacter sp. HDW4A]
MTSSSTSTINAQMTASSPHTLSSGKSGGVWRMALAMALSGTIGLFVIESGLPVELVVLSRCVIGSLALALWITARREWVALSRVDLVWMAVGGVALVINWVALFHAYAFAGIGIATVVYHVQPFFLVLVSALGGEVIGWRRVPYMVLALAGVVLSSGVVHEMQLANTAASHGQSVVQGVLLSLLAAALYTLTVVATRRVKQVPPAQTAMLQMTAGGVVLALWALPMLLGGAALRSASVPLVQTLACVATLGLVHTALMYVIMYGAFQRLGAAAIAILSFIYPAIALTVDLLWFGIRPDAWQWLGIAMIAAAIAGYRISELRAAKA